MMNNVGFLKSVVSVRVKIALGLGFHPRTSGVIFKLAMEDGSRKCKTFLCTSTSTVIVSSNGMAARLLPRTALPTRCSPPFLRAFLVARGLGATVSTPSGPQADHFASVPTRHFAAIVAP